MGMKKVFILLAGVLFFFNVSAVDKISDAQAMFIYNFSRLVDWPIDNMNGEFVIGIVGHSELERSLVNFMKNKTVDGQKVVVKKYKDESEVGACHMLFVSYGKSSKMGDITGKLQNSNTLIIGEKKGLTQEGAAISFVIAGNKLKFELNTENASKYDLRVSNSLAQMAL